MEKVKGNEEREVGSVSRQLKPAYPWNANLWENSKTTGPLISIQAPRASSALVKCNVCPLGTFLSWTFEKQRKVHHREEKAILRSEE